jgi:hypothetical protein
MAGDNETGCLQDGDGSRARSLEESESIPVGPTTENSIAFGSVSTPLRRDTGVVGDGESAGTPGIVGR